MDSSALEDKTLLRGTVLDNILISHSAIPGSMSDEAGSILAVRLARSELDAQVERLDWFDILLQPFVSSIHTSASFLVPPSPFKVRAVQGVEKPSCTTWQV